MRVILSIVLAACAAVACSTSSKKSAPPSAAVSCPAGTQADAFTGQCAAPSVTATLPTPPLGTGTGTATSAGSACIASGGSWNTNGICTCPGGAQPNPTTLACPAATGTATSPAVGTNVTSTAVGTATSPQQACVASGGSSNGFVCQCPNGTLFNVVTGACVSFQTGGNLEAGLCSASGGQLNGFNSICRCPPGTVTTVERNQGLSFCTTNGIF